MLLFGCAGVAAMPTRTSKTTHSKHVHWNYVQSLRLSFMPDFSRIGRQGMLQVQGCNGVKHSRRFGVGPKIHKRSHLPTAERIIKTPVPTGGANSLQKLPNVQTR